MTDKGGSRKIKRHRKQESWVREAGISDHRAPLPHPPPKWDYTYLCLGIWPSCPHTFKNAHNHACESFTFSIPRVSPAIILSESDGILGSFLLRLL